MTNLWAEASRDHDAEVDAQQRMAAKVAVSGYWPLLAQASSEREFDHRLAVVRDKMIEAMRQAQVTSARFHEETLAGVREDFRLLASTRKDASERGASATCPVCYRENVALRNGKLVTHQDTTREGNPQCDGTGKTASRKQAASTRVTTLRRIVERHQHEEIDGMIVDVQTANLLLQVYDALSDKNKARFDDLPLERLVDLGWKHSASRKEAIWPFSRKEEAPASTFVPRSQQTTVSDRYTPESLRQMSDIEVEEYDYDALDGDWLTPPEKANIRAEYKRRFGSRKQAAESGWTGMDAIDEAGLHAGPEHCSQGNPACNWGWADKDGQKVYRCSVHGTEQTKSHTTEGSTMAGHLSSLQGYFTEGGVLDKIKDRLRPKAPTAPERDTDHFQETMFDETDDERRQRKRGPFQETMFDEDEPPERSTRKASSRKTATMACPQCSGIAVASAGKVECMDCGHTASRRTAGAMEEHRERMRSQFQGNDDHKPVLHQEQDFGDLSPGIGNYWIAGCTCGWEQPKGNVGGPRGFPSEEQALRRWNNHFRSEGGR